ncbi:MAG: glycine--tRNA ligase subunit beta [Synergistaceae bacterium]|jgi:glycyl-tRNA synthetase beta chain|nr:glycine--tRNA ligase subunit beta [Synergistaceae bacterium]
MMGRDLLFEIGTEEIPARFMTWVIGELDRLARQGLSELRVPFGDLKVTGTPRRIVLLVNDLAERQDDFEETVKGPPRTQSLNSDGEFTAAALGFARSRGVDVSDLTFASVKGVEYLHAVVRKPGMDTGGLLPDFLSGLIKKIVFPKSMYWEEQGLRFARPVRWIVAFWGDERIPVFFGSVESGHASRGHRFMGSGSVVIKSASEYMAAMEREFVIVDHERRKSMILDGIAEIERSVGGSSDDDPELLEENAQLTEYPVPFCGSFEDEFLDIPEEVLIATMKKNQRYFPVRDKDGRLMARFIGVSNNRARDMNVVRGGNERVLRARLYDAAFFWREDRTRALESRLPQLKKVLYQERLGSIYDKSERVRALAGWLVKAFDMEDIAKPVDRASVLAKTDLVTGMVFEFPEVQGVMGREYAKREGESAEVSDALFEQYLPRFAGDQIPKGRVGAVLGICDRVDSIIGIHKIGMSPSGSQDPYGLRRAARGINEILWGLALDIDMGDLFGKAAENLAADDATMESVREFYRQRLHNQLRERGHAHGTTSLVVSSMWNRPLQALRMLDSFDEVSGEEWFVSLVLSAVRVNNILNKIPESELLALKPASSLATLPEQNLKSALDRQSPLVTDALLNCDWKAVCEALSELSGVISGFFDGVMVMDPDPEIRVGRVELLSRCRALFDSIGDFSLLK